MMWTQTKGMEEPKMNIALLLLLFNCKTAVYLINYQMARLASLSRYVAS